MINKDLKRRLQERGITLVALVVTIIILLILAGVTLNLALGQNGIFARARNTVDRYQSAQANELGQLSELEKQLDKYGNGGTSTGGDEETTNTVTPPPTQPESGSSAEKLSEKLSGEDSVVGKTVTGLTGGVADRYTWEILYADKNNIYLISTDYIEVADCPKKDGVAVTEGSYTERDAYCEADLLAKYAGSSSINDIGKKLNSDYFSESKNYSSIKDNMKSVAYMLDTDIWKEKIVGTNDKVDYVVGGPSIELLFTAYNAKKKTDYRAQASSAMGYKISKNSGGTWANYYDSMLDTSESTFVITSQTNASAYWLSSPSAESCYIMLANFEGYVGFNRFGTLRYGFRPVVCLSSSVVLEEDGDGYKIKQ